MKKCKQNTNICLRIQTETNVKTYTNNFKINKKTYMKNQKEI